MHKNQKGFSLIEALLVFVVLALVGAGGWYVYNKQSSASTDSSTTATDAQSQEEDSKTLTFEFDPTFSVTYGKGWSQLTEFGYPRDGLVKSINDRNYQIDFKSYTLDYDYMDRSAGGAYPVGTLYKEITPNGKVHQIGIVADMGFAYMSTCPITKNGGCSLVLPSGIVRTVDLHVLDATDPSGRGKMDFSRSDDKQILDEFVEILSTLKY